MITFKRTQLNTTLMKVSLIIPAYNEAETLLPLIKSIPPSVHEIIIVDDGSTDNTADVVQCDGVTVVRHPRNMGKGVAMVSGIQKATGDVIVFMDADLQHHPDDITRLLAAVEDGSDLAIGVRTLGSRKTMPPQRRITNFLGNLLVYLRIGKWISDTQSGFRAIKKEFLEKMKFKSKRYEIEIEMLLWAHRLKMRIKEVPILVKYGEEKSHWKVRNLFRVFRILY
jgi:glycosyltransferase involved in cell wall biosynthesis